MLAGLLVVLCSATTLAESATAASACPPSWSVVPSPNPSGGTNRLGAVAALSVTSAWAVGHSLESGTSTPLILRWNGTAWTAATPPSAPSGELAGVAALSANDAIAVGHSTTGGDQPLILRWNGTSWSDVTPAGLPAGRLLGVSATSSGNVVAAGYSTSGGDKPLIVRWDGSDWSDVTPVLAPTGRLRGVTTVSGADAVAVGYQDAAGVNKALIMRLVAGTWADVTPLTPPDGELNGVFDVTGSDVWAVGSTAAQTLTMHWNGVAWSTESSPNSGSANRLAAVAAEGASDVWAVGEADGQTLTMHWDGAGWSIIASPNAGTSALHGVTTISGTDAWAVGAGGSQTLTEHYGACPSISGRVTSGGVGLQGATVTLGGSATGTATTDADGDYSFSDIAAAGDYTITPSKSGYSFSPTSRSYDDVVYPVSGANFSATLNVHSISGSITVGGSPLAGVTVTLSGGPGGTDTTDASGQYAFSNLPAGGDYTVTPSKTHYAFAPPSAQVANLSANETRDFTATLNTHTVSGRITEGGSGLAGVTVTLSGTSSGTASTDADGNYSFSNLGAGGNYTVTPAKAHYTFSPSSRTFNNLSGNADADFSATLNRHTISGTITAGGSPLAGVTVTLSGGPGGTDTTDASGQYSFANLPAGGDYTVTPAKPNYTFSPASRSFTDLGGNQTANFTATLNTHSISGSITVGGSPLAGVTVTLSGGPGGTDTTDAGGNYSFANLPAGLSYTVTPAKTHYTFAPPSAQLTNLSANETRDFAATLNTHSISGTVRLGGSPLAGVTVTLSGGPGGTDTTDAGGNYSFANLPAGVSYTVTPAKTHYTFAPPSATVANLGANETRDFTATLNRHTISGRITEGGSGLSGVQVMLSGSSGGTATTNASGDYSFTNLAAGGSYTATPSKANYVFAPASRSFSDLGADQSADFAATAVRLSIADATVAEGNGTSTVTASFAVTLSTATPNTVTVQYATADGTANAPGDYTSSGGTVTFSPGDTSENVAVTVKGDDLDEDDETFTVTLSSPQHAALADGQATGSITDNDPLAALSVNDVSVDEAAGTLTFAVRLTPASGRVVTVDYTTANDTAVAPGDYATKSGTLTFNKGQLEQTVSITIANDAIDEADERFFLNLSNAPKAAITDGQGAGTIRDNDLPPALHIDDRSVDEAAAGPSGTLAVSFTVTLCAPGTGGSGQPACAPVESGLPVTLSYATADGTATAGKDYVGIGATALAFSPGTKTRSVTVTVNGDRFYEGDETYFVDLSAQVNATLAKARGTGTIRNDDRAPGVSVGDASTAEGGTADFTITLCAPDTGGAGQPACVPIEAGLEIRVNYNALKGGDCGASPPAFPTLDFMQIGGQRAITPGSSTAGFSVQTTADRLQEPDKKFCGEVSLPTEGAVVVRRFGIGTIVDDDSDPSVSIENVSLVEGDGGTTLAVFNVAFSNPSENGASIKWATQSGTATSPADFTGASGTVTMEPPDPETFDYQLLHRLEVPVAADALDEADESFTVVLSEPTGASIAEGRGIATATIVDDDALPAAITGEASGVTLATATLNGLVNPSAKQTSVSFEYGLTTSYGSSTPEVALGADAVDHPLAAAVSGLAFGSVYHYRVVATNATGSVYGADRTFRTALPAPEALTGAATAVTERGASLGGTARTFGQEVAVWFEYGSSVAYGQQTAAQAIPAGAQQQAEVTRAVTGLTGGTTYHYRLVVRRGGEAPVPGADRTFRTLAATGGGGGGKKGPPSLKLAGKVLTVDAAGMAPLTMRCGSQTSGSCRGSVIFEGPAPALAGKGAKKRKLTYGRASFTIKPGKKLTVKVRLSALARRTLKATRTLRVTAVITFRDSRGTRVKKRVTITLKAPKKRL